MAKGKKTLKAGNVRTAIDLPEALWARVQHHAIDAKTTARKIVVQALETYLAKKGGRT